MKLNVTIPPNTTAAMIGQAHRFRRRNCPATWIVADIRNAWENRPVTRPTADGDVSMRTPDCSGV
jgi:hypothetical protein